jgi:hypothetical protein
LKTIKEIGICLLCLIALSVLAVQSSQCARSETSAKWTFMVYMDADNNLDAFAPYSLGMMEEIGSTESVNVVVLWDSFYRPAYMYKVVQGGIEEVKGFALNGEEANMGDSATLEAFVDCTLREFPAEHYVLVLWDHGNDVSGICWDENPEDHLTHPEVASALSGHHIDILATDACLMAMVEVAYEYNQYGLDTDYLVGSENYVPVNGYPYNTILEGMNQDPSMSELELAHMITGYFAEFYRPRAHFRGGVMATLSAVELAKMDEVVSSLSVLTAALTEDIEANHELISGARGEGMLPWSEYGWDRYVDMSTFVETIMLETHDLDIRDAATAVLSRLEEVIVALGNTKPMESASAKGLGIWFPPSYHATRGLSTYTTTRFASQGWLDFLHAYWNDDHI